MDSLSQNCCNATQDVHCFGFPNTSLSQPYDLQCDSKLERRLKVLLDPKMKSRKHN